MSSTLVDQVLQVYGEIDQVISHHTYQFFDYFGADMRPTTYVTENWPLVSSPTPLVLLLVKYCIVVFTAYGYISYKQKKEKAAGLPPQKMWTDGPLLALFVQFHNIFLAVLSGWMCLATVYYAYTTGYPFWGVAFDAERDGSSGLSFVFYIFYLSKFYEFFDTYIMLWKGNLRQVSTLHVYHHISTAIIFWMVSKQAPGGDAYSCIMLNSFVHTVMYSYYFLTTVIPRESRKKYLWWGQYLTQLQMTQFVVNLVHAVWAFFYSPYWFTGKVLQLVDMLVLLPFFLHFYINRYLKPAVTDRASPSAAVVQKTKKD